MLRCVDIVAGAIGSVWLAHFNIPQQFEGVRREDRWSVPLVAIREALMNAIVHAAYAQQGAAIRVALFDDRIEIENPGLLPFSLTMRTLCKVSPSCGIA
jgi:predicted HTH transcriptional regulator